MLLQVLPDSMWIDFDNGTGIRADASQFLMLPRPILLSGTGTALPLSSGYYIERQNNKEKDSNVKHSVGLAFILAIFWLINSGHFQGYLLGLGLLSVAGVVIIVRHMEVTDQEHTPVHLSKRLLFYIPWLGREVIKSNIDVVRKIWQPAINISPRVITVRASQKSDTGKVIYANSITMTPGTVTLDIQEDVFEVHALTREMAEDLQQGEMDRRVTRVES